MYILKNPYLQLRLNIQKNII